MIKSLGLALIIGFTSINCLPTLANTKTNLELPKSETVISEDIDGDGRKELFFYMGDDTTEEKIYLFLKPDGVKKVYLGVTDLPGAKLNENFDLQFFRGKVFAQWNRSEQLWKSQDNRYLWTLGDCVEIRERPDARSKIVRMISKNEILSVFQPQTASGWIGVDLDGQKGWIKINNISFTSPVSMIRFAKP